MDLKKPGFGGPNSAKEYRDGRGNIANPKPKLKEYQRVVERDPLFSHPHYNSTYKAMTHDVVYKQAKKKPFTYKDPYITAIPVVQVGAMQEGRACSSFENFLNEAEMQPSMQPSMKGGRMFKLRGKTDRDAMSMAEEILLDERIDYDSLANPPAGINGRGFKNKAGEIVAFVDTDRRELVVLPNSSQMSNMDYQRIQDPNMMQQAEEPSEETEDFYDDLEDRDKEYYDDEEDAAEIDDTEDLYTEPEEEYYGDEKEETEEIEGERPIEPTESDVESLLRSFETEDGEEEEEI